VLPSRIAGWRSRRISSGDLVRGRELEEELVELLEPEELDELE
jgi:hypothetical protein